MGPPDLYAHVDREHLGARTVSIGDVVFALG
jgi:hypothetical protein